MRHLILFVLFLSVQFSPLYAEQQGAPIRFGLSAAPVTLDPRQATDAVSQRINRLLYRQLVDFDDHYRMTPALADWRELGPTHYRFMLRPEGRAFHDGTHLTSLDVKATYEAVLAEGNISPHRATLLNIRAIDVIDEDTVDFFLHRADSLFPGRLVIGILPAALIAARHPFQGMPVGSGPLKFVAWPDENRLLLERVADGQGLAFITAVDPTVRVLKLMRGELDLTQGELPAELSGWLEQKPGIAVERKAGDTFTYIGFNLRDPALSRLNVRRAIAHAVNRDDVIKYLLGGMARRAGGLFTPGHWAGHPGLDGYDYNPERARQLLAGEGFGPDHPLRLVWKTSNNPLRLRLATVMQYQLRQVGIDVELRSYDWGTFYGDIKAGNFQMYSLSWVGLKMTDIFRYIFHSSSLPPAGANRGYYHDTAVDALIDRAEIEIDPAQQAAWYRELQGHLLEQLPYLPLWYEDNVLARREGISGYTMYPDGSYDGLAQVRKVVIGD